MQKLRKCLRRIRLNEREVSLEKTMLAPTALKRGEKHVITHFKMVSSKNGN